MSTARRRFVHVFATFGAGGPQVRAVQLVRHLGADCEHAVMAMDGRTEAAAMLDPAARVEIVAPPPRRGFLANVRTQAAWLRAQRPDLVLTYNWGAIETAAAARRLGLPRVHHEDGFLPDEAARRLRRRSWMRRFVLRSTRVVVPSLVLQRIALREWGLRSDRVFHLPNGVDLRRFRPAPPRTRAAGTFVAGTVGGLRPEKDHATFLRALAALGPDVHGTIVGGGALEAALKQQACELGLAGRVAFAGPVADTSPCYAPFDVFVLSSRTEQMPLVLLEAMACGLPVVATDVGDVRLILPPEAAEGIVPANDPGALAAALQRLQNDPARRVVLGAANRRRVEERYELGACLDRFARVYAEAANGAR